MRGGQHLDISAPDTIEQHYQGAGTMNSIKFKKQQNKKIPILMKKATLLFAILFMAGKGMVNAQVNVGSTAAADPSAMLQVTSTNRGFRPPQVSISYTRIFTLTAPTVANAAKGMVVYNTNKNITGDTTYPGNGVGLYTWDGTGWQSAYYTNVVEYVANGKASASAAPGTSLSTPLAVTLDLDSVAYIQASDVTVSGTTLTLSKAGNYKFDITIQATLQPASGVNETNYADILCYMLINGGIIDKAAASILPATNGTNAGLTYLLSRSYNYSAAAAGSQFTVQAGTYGFSSSSYCIFKIISLQITRINN